MPDTTEETGLLSNKHAIDYRERETKKQKKTQEIVKEWNNSFLKKFSAPEFFFLVFASNRPHEPAY